MTGLAGWLSACADEDAAVAMAVLTACRDARAPWPPEQPPGNGGPVLTAYLRHFSEHRMLAEAEFKRAVLALHHPEQWNADGGPDEVHCAECTDDDDLYKPQMWPCPTVRAMAGVFKDRPGYQEAVS